MNELQILPITLYEFKAPNNIHNIVVEYMNNIDWGEESHRFDVQHFGKSTKQFLHKEKKLKDFINWQTEQVNTVKEKEKFKYCKSFMPTSMWANKSETNEWHHRHSHGWSFLSCIYFVSGESGDTWFSRKSDYYAQNMNLRDDYDIDICYVHKFKPKTLLVFPSKLEHSVSENLSNKPRLSISTNYLPTGNVGSGMGYSTEFTEFPWSF